MSSRETRDNIEKAGTTARAEAIGVPEMCRCVESRWSPHAPEKAPGVQMESKSLVRKSFVFIDGCL
jgi:hypothetical protein